MTFAAPDTGASSYSPATWRSGLFRLAFATVAGASLAQAVAALWPAPAYDAHAIGFAVWAHQPPGLQTVYYLAFLIAGALVYGLAPWLLQRVTPRPDPAAAADNSNTVPWAPWLGWLWVAAAAVLPWQAAQAWRLGALVLIVAGLCRWLRWLAAEPARWRTAQLGLGVAAIGYGAGLCVLDIFPAPTRGMLDWYNPLVCGVTVLFVFDLWWGLTRRLRRHRPEEAGALRAAWYLLPLGLLPPLGIALQASDSPWGAPAIGPRYYALCWFVAAAIFGTVLVALMQRELRRAEAERSPEDRAVYEAAATERWLNRVAWLIVPAILFAMTHERNLRMIGFSQNGLQFDFMHWGEWWDPWWRLQTGGRLWVDLFPIHGAGYDIGPCALAAWAGDATLSGRIVVAAVLNAASFVCLYLGLLAITRRRAIGLLGLALIVWNQPSWFKIWIGDTRFLPLFVWVLALVWLARALRPSAGGAGGATTPQTGGRGWWAAAAAVGLLPLVNFLTSVDTGYVTIVATGGMALALGLFGPWLAGIADAAAVRRTRLAGAILGGAMLLSLGAFWLWLGERQDSFWTYHRRVFTDKGWFDSLPLMYTDALTVSKAIYMLAPPVLVAIVAAVGWQARRRGGAAVSGETTGANPAVAVLGVVLVTALYYKKGLDRSDTAHFEHAAVLAPVLLGVVLTVAAAAYERRGGRGLMALTCGGMLAWLGLTQTVETYASHPARWDIWATQAPVDPRAQLHLPRAGALQCTLAQVEPLRETWQYIQDYTGETEPIFDFTNSGLWPFLADRPSPARYSQTFHAMDDAMQDEVIADLTAHPPRLVLFPDRPVSVDFVDLTLRQHRVSAWLLKHYQPVAHVGYYLMLAPDSLAASDPIRVRAAREYPPLDAARFIGEQDQGFVPRAFADQVARKTPAVDLPVALDPAVTMAPNFSASRGVSFSAWGPGAVGRFETISPNARICLDVPAGLPVDGADWLEIDMAVSGGTAGALTFLSAEPAKDATGASDPNAIDPAAALASIHAWWRPVRFRIEPTKQAAQSRKYRFHLAAMPNWIFLRGKIARIELQPTDTAGITVEIHSVTFFKEAQR